MKKGRRQVEERKRWRVSKVRVEMAQTSRDTRAEMASSSDEKWAQRLKCL